MKVVNEWASLVDRSIQAIADSFQDGNPVSLRGARTLLAQSDARDIIRGLAHTDLAAGELFQLFDKTAHDFLDDALLVKRMMELTPGTRASDHRGEFRQMQNLSPTISEERRRLKEKLMEMADGLGRDLLIERNGHWDDFVKHNDIAPKLEVNE